MEQQTHVFYKENKDEPKELGFKDRINLPYEAGNDEEEKEEVMQAHKEFVPSRLVSVPFMTILRKDPIKKLLQKTYLLEVISFITWIKSFTQFKIYQMTRDP